MNEDYAKDLYNDFKAGISRRTGDPLFSTYAISFLIWNYSVFIYLFSDLNADQKVERIRGVIHNEWAFGVPFLFSIIVIALPHLIKSPYLAAMKAQVILRNLKTEADRDLIEYQQQLEVMRRQLDAEVNRVNDANDKLSAKDQEIGKLKQEIHTVEELLEKSRVSSSSEADIPNLSGEPLALYQYLVKNKLLGIFEEIASRSEVRNYPDVDKYDAKELSKLSSKKLVEIFNGSLDERLVCTTNIGSDLYKALL